MRKPIIIILIIVGLLVFWFKKNPIWRFGYSRPGLIVYSAIPFPKVDLKIYSNGYFSTTKIKKHRLSKDDIKDVIREGPEFLIIGNGYKGEVKVNDEVFDCGVKVEVLLTPNAIKRFNELKDKSKTVAAIIHSIH